MTALSASDLARVTEQLGRDPDVDFEVIARCADGHPLVIRNHPVDREGKPFPTRYWLTCPRARRLVGRLEGDGWIKLLSERAEEEPDFGRALEEAHRVSAAERGRVVPGAEAWGGVGGTRRGLKCLHAHYANHLAGGEDPVGAWVAERVEPVHAGADALGLVAAVDMGTNSIRLLVARRSEGDLSEVARDMVITRLGEAVDEAGRFDPDAVERTLDVLGRYVRRARAMGAARVRVAATSAVRDVAARETVSAAVEALGAGPLEVLAGEQEGRLSFLGATGSLDRPAPFLVLDIGGGSTELVLGSERPEAAVSVDVGSVRVTERVRPSDPPTASDLRAMEEIVSRALAEAEKAIAPGRAGTAVAVAGTATTVQALALGLPRYDPEAIHGSLLSLAEAERVAADLAGMSVAERAALPVMAQGREDVIVAGCRILLEVFRRWGLREFVVSERDILDGLVMEMVAPREAQ